MRGKVEEGADWRSRAQTVGRISHDARTGFDPVVPNPARRRRKGEILRTAAATSVVGVALGTAATFMAGGVGEPSSPSVPPIPAEKPLTVPREFGKPYQYFTGEITIRMDKGLNVRTEPKLSEQGGYSNKKDWTQVISIKGENLQGAEGFNIKNAKIVRGGAVGPTITGGDWILLENAVVKDGNKLVTMDLYVSMGNTYEFVRVSPVGHRKDIYQQGGKILASDGEFGQVRALRPTK